MRPMLLRVAIDDGSSDFIEVEVDRPEQTSSVDLTAAGDVDVATASFSLASSLDKTLPALQTILQRLRIAEDAPDEISLQMGLKIGGETGLIFAKGTAEATFAISLTWRRA